MEPKELKKATRAVRDMLGFAQAYAKNDSPSQLFNAFLEAADAIKNLTAVIEVQQKEIAALKAKLPR